MISSMDVHTAAARVASSKRILILGSPGSGKTTLAIRLGRVMDLRTIHLDAHFWKPGWISTPQSQWRTTVASLIQQDAWIMDGTYESSLDLRISAAESIILLESSRWTCLWGALKRRATVDDHHRPDAPSGQKLELAFLRYIWQYPVVTRPFVSECIRNYGPEKNVIQLEGSRKIQEFLLGVQEIVDREMP